MMKNNVVSSMTPDGLKITVKSGNLGLFAVFLSLWLVAMTYGAIAATSHIIRLSGNSFPPLTAVWLAWAAVSLLPASILYWGLTGREIITAGLGMMKVRNEILGAGWNRSFEIALISGMRMNMTTGKGLFDARAGQNTGRKSSAGMGLIDFNYRGKINRFCLSTDNKDAEAVIEELKKALPENIFG